MKKNKEEKIVKRHKYDKSQIFVKIVAGILAILMMAAALYTVVYFIFAR